MQRTTITADDTMPDDPREPSGTVLARPPDADAIRLRALLVWLRPDLADPSEPPPRITVAVSHAPAPRDPTACWGGIPANAFRGPASGSEGGGGGHRTLADVRGVLGAMEATGGDDALAARVLWWLRENAREADGVRGVAVAVAIAHLPGALPEGIGARREAGYLLGRRLLWGAARAVGL